MKFIFLGWFLGTTNVHPVEEWKLNPNITTTTGFAYGRVSAIVQIGIPAKTIFYNEKNKPFILFGIDYKILE